MTTIEMRGISKHFPPSMTALDKVDFIVEPGEIHCLLGENGAGKTTLMNILYGLYRANTGKIKINGSYVKINSPRDAIDLKIGMVHQHFHLIKKHTVAENVALGLKDTNLLFPLTEIKPLIHNISTRYGLTVDPEKKIWELSVGEQQRVEIIKVLCRDIEVLILDEPTSILTPQETKALFNSLQLLKEEGMAIVFITHKLEEVMTFSDKVTVLRKGKKIDTVATSKIDLTRLAKMMVDREILFKLDKTEAYLTKPILEVNELVALNDSGITAVNKINFTICGGEILGIAGISGNGQRELIEVITGLRESSTGTVNINGQNINGLTSNEISKIGVAHIPEDRIQRGSIPNMTVLENLMLRDYPMYGNGVFLGSQKMRQDSQTLIEDYNVDTPSLDTPLKILSGGNIQKIILARELNGNPSLIIASHPTYGLDIGATEQIRRILCDRRSQGAAVLLVSEDLDEILDLSDRIIVIYEGRIIGEVSSETDISEIGLMMLGANTS